MMQEVNQRTAMDRCFPTFEPKCFTYWAFLLISTVTLAFCFVQIFRGDTENLPFYTAIISGIIGTWAPTPNLNVTIPRSIE
jgi:hypothetical protein